MNIPHREGEPQIIVQQKQEEGEFVFFVDAPRHVPRHACRMKDYGLVEHLRCVVCGKCKEKKSHVSEMASCLGANKEEVGG